MLDLGLFFPTIIGTDYNIELAETLLPIAKKHLDNNSKTNLNYNSTYDSGEGIENDENIKLFLEYIRTKAEEYLEKSGYDSSKISLTPKIFVSEMKKGDSHNLHVHPNCKLSGIMYLQIPDGSAPIVFSDVRSAKRMLSLPRRTESILNQTEFPIFPKKGMFLIWESWLTHSVPKNYTDDGRITIVFNFS